MAANLLNCKADTSYQSGNGGGCEEYPRAEKESLYAAYGQGAEHRARLTVHGKGVVFAAVCIVQKPHGEQRVDIPLFFKIQREVYNIDGGLTLDSVSLGLLCALADTLIYARGGFILSYVVLFGGAARQIGH